MLYLSRKVGESIVINNNITMTVTEVRGRTVKIGFSFPPDATILRKEVHDRISAENKAALGGGDLGNLDFEIEIDFDADQGTKE
jgi:carbon storage regulator